MKQRLLNKKFLLSIFVISVLVFFINTVTESNAQALKQTGPADLGRHLVNKDILAGIDLLYDERFNDAEILFQKVISDSPERPYGYFYLAMVTWSRMAAGFWSPETVDEYKERIDWTIQVAQSRIKSNAADSYDYLYLGGALGFKGRFELMRGKWFSSFLLASDAIDALKTCQKMDPNNKDVLLGLGTFDYYTAHLSGVLKFLTYLLLHQGNKQEGLRKLNLAAREATYSATEAKSMLLHIYLFLERDFLKALHLADELAKKYERSSCYEILRGVSYIRLGMETEYRECVLRLREKSLLAPSIMEAARWGKRALYLDTVYDLFHGHYRLARSRLNVILKRTDPENDPAMIAWPLIKIGMSYDLEGNREKAIKYYRQILDMENGSGAQFLAKKCLKTPPKKDDPFIGF